MPQLAFNSSSRDGAYLTIPVLAVLMTRMETDHHTVRTAKEGDLRGLHSHH